MSKLAENIREHLLTLENDIEVLGWDQPSFLYIVEEVDNNPCIIKAAEFHDHPCDVLANAPQLNPDVAKGVVLVNECWMAEVPKEAIEYVRNEMTKDGIPEQEQDQLVEEAVRYFYQLIPPSQNPARIECRWVSCVLSDGTHICLHRKRGEEPEFFDEGILDGRVLDSLKALYGLEGS